MRNVIFGAARRRGLRVLANASRAIFQAMTRQLDLELVTSKTYANGCVEVNYRVKR